MSASIANRLYDLKSQICTIEFTRRENKKQFSSIYVHSNYKYEVSLERSWNKLSIGSMQIVMTSMMTSLEGNRSMILVPCENQGVPGMRGADLSYAGPEQGTMQCNL